MTTITHSAECERRQRIQAAWLLLYPNHCRPCHGQGEFYYPGVYRYADGSGEPPSSDLCICLETGICPRCLQALDNVNPFRVMAYIFQSKANTTMKDMRYALSPDSKYGQHPIYGDYERRLARWTEFYRGDYMVLVHLASQYYDLANQYDRMCGIEPWTDSGAEPPVCIHCGYGHGKYIHDYMPNAECDCWIVEG